MASSANGKKRIAIWAPFRGRVGTVQAAANYAHLCRDMGFEVVFIELCDEWSGHEAVAENYPVVSLTKSKRLKNIGKSNFFRRRDFFAFSFLKIGALHRALRELQPDIVISMLCTVPLIRAAKKLPPRLIGSIQGFPRFLNKAASGNLYYRLEDDLRRALWRRHYRHLDEILCMTPDTAEELSAALKRDCVFCPNPLFASLPETTLLDDLADRGDDAPIDFLAMGRFSKQKRFDLAVGFFARTGNIYPTARLHFFGDVSASEMTPHMSALSKEQAARVVFHGYQPSPWERISSEFNPVHLVSAAWEDPGHAILEGLGHGIPTLFINPLGNYAGFYRRAAASFLTDADADADADADMPQGDAIRDAVARAQAPQARRHLRVKIAAQFCFDAVAKKLAPVLHV